jgi:hypothetical protein
MTDTAERTEQDLIRELSVGLNQTLDRCEALEAELAEAKTRLASFESAFAEGGTLGVLQRLTHDPAIKTELRIRAASAAVAFERPKLAMTASVQPVKLFDILEARKNAGKVIEQAPGPETILGGPDSAA